MFGTYEMTFSKAGVFKAKFSSLCVWVTSQFFDWSKQRMKQTRFAEVKKFSIEQNFIHFWSIGKFRRYEFSKVRNCWEISFQSIVYLYKTRWLSSLSYWKTVSLKFAEDEGTFLRKFFFKLVPKSQFQRLRFNHCKGNWISCSIWRTWYPFKN